MAAYIQTLQDQTGNSVYPVTKMECIYDGNNRTLDEREIRLDAFEITTDTTQIDNEYITSTSLIDIYYADPNYKIEPTYEQRDGTFIIRLSDVPDEAITVSAVVIKNI